MSKLVKTEDDCFKEIMDLYNKLVPNSNLKENVIPKIRKILNRWDNVEWGRFKEDEEIEWHDTKRGFEEDIINLVFPFLDQDDPDNWDDIENILHHPFSPIWGSDGFTPGYDSKKLNIALQEFLESVLIELDSKNIVKEELFVRTFDTYCTLHNIPKIKWCPDYYKKVFKSKKITVYSTTEHYKSGHNDHDIIHTYIKGVKFT